MTNLSRAVRMLGQSVLALVTGSTLVYAQPTREPTFPSHSQVPLSYYNWLELKGNPEELNRLLSRPAPLVSQALTAGAVTEGPWQRLPIMPGGAAANPLLLTDGTVIVHQGSTPTWWKLTPDINGSYVNGTWSQIARMASNYGPRYFGSQVLPDGRVEINGGEYNLGSPIWTNQGAIYNPLFGAWRSISPPSGWSHIGDAQTVVLSDGTYMLADCCDLPPSAALLDASTLTWTATGNKKFDVYSEEGWTLLPSGDVLTVDAYVFMNGMCGTNSELYLSAFGFWQTAGSTIRQLSDCNGNFPSYEMGPALLRPDGTVIAFGGTTTGRAHTSIFNSATLTWTAGPDIPSINGVPYTLADAPAALLPSGNVLFAASPSNWTRLEQFPTPTHFFEINLANNITQVADNPDGAFLSSFEWNFLVLPTGQILAVETDTPYVWIYNPSGSPDPAWAPVISTYPSAVSRGSTYRLAGTQFNGRSQGAAYGDDVQGATDYPIVAIVNNATGHVFYERTSGFTISLAPNAPSSTNVTITGVTETGPSTLYVIANGISSTGAAILVQ